MRLARLPTLALAAALAAAPGVALAEAEPAEAAAEALAPEEAPPQARGRGRLVLVVRHPGVRVRLDGGPPLEGAVAAGRHVVEVRLEGYEVWEQEVEVRPDEVTRVRVELTPTPARRRELERRRAALAAAAWATAAAGVAVLGTALGLYLWNDHRYAEWNGERLALYEDFNLPPAEMPDPSELVARARGNDDLIASIREVDTASWALLGVGLGAVVAALGLGFALRAVAPEAEPEVAVAPTPSGLGLAMTWSLP